MDDPLGYGFVGREPEQRALDLAKDQVRDLCAYIYGLAVLRGEQLRELGLDADRLSPDGLRGMASFLRSCTRRKDTCRTHPECRKPPV